LSKNDDKQWPPTCPAALLHIRAELYQSIRLFFAEKGVLEVDTPVLSQSASCDVNLDSFSTAFNQTSYYLQTSPEFTMKRLLAAGAGSIFQIAKSFRQGESGRYHNPEFTLLEWYRVEFSMTELIEEVVELLMNCFNENLSFSSVSYARLFHRYTNINPHETTIEELLAYASSEGNPEMASVCGDSLSNCLDFVFSQYIQPKLKPNLVYIVTDYPVCMAMLAKLSDDFTPTAKRFEVYFNNIELANGYEELTDASEQQQRFHQELKEREDVGADSVPMDGYLLAALEHGLPNCSGVALGLDRLLMLMTNVASIDEVLTFPINRA